jgi:hypothetical protein
MKFKSFCVIASLVFALQPAAVFAQAQQAETLRTGITAGPTEARSRIEELTRQILLKQIALEKFNIRYSQNVAKQGRWKGWRYAAFQEANSGLGLAGGIVGTWQRGSHLEHPGRVNTHTQESANYIPMIGSIIGASAAMMEFGLNNWHDLEARSKGFSPGKAKKYVTGVKNDIDTMLAERQALVQIEAAAPMLTTNADVDQLEGKILADMRNQSLLEFERFHVGARKLFAFQQMQYMFDTAKYTLNAVGAELAYLSLCKHRRIWNGRAGIMFNISGALYIAGPVVSRVFAKGVGEAHKLYISSAVRDARGSSMETLVQDRTALENYLAQHRGAAADVSPAFDRSVIYSSREKRFQTEYAAGEKARDRSRLTATQNIGAGAFVGGATLAKGILFTVPGFKKTYRASTKYAGRVTNNDLFAASVVGLPATSFSILDTLRIQVQGEISRQNAMKAGVHPSQLARQRLVELDDMEAKLQVH